jgi:hypothetical protein
MSLESQEKSMTEKLICPECKSNDVNFLAIGGFNSYMYGCGDCYHTWGDIKEMTNESNRRCCNFGCEVEKIASEGYRVSFGFMLWACPEHADQWKEFDKQDRQYENVQGDAYQIAYKEWEGHWYKQYQLDNPSPIVPKYQPSTKRD